MGDAIQNNTHSRNTDYPHMTEPSHLTLATLAHLYGKTGRSLLLTLNHQINFLKVNTKISCHKNLLVNSLLQA